MVSGGRTLQSGSDKAVIAGVRCACVLLSIISTNNKHRQGIPALKISHAEAMLCTTITVLQRLTFIVTMENRAPKPRPTRRALHVICTNHFSSVAQLEKPTVLFGTLMEHIMASMHKSVTRRSSVAVTMQFVRESFKVAHGVLQSTV